MVKFPSYIFACTIIFAATAASSQESQPCLELLKRAGDNLKVIRSGDLIGDGAREFVAVREISGQRSKQIHISRLLIVRLEQGRCSVVLDATKDGPKNPAGYIGIDYIDDSAPFYGYEFEFGSDRREAGPEPRYKAVMFLSWLTVKHQSEGQGIVIGWNEKVRRFQEIDSSWEFFKPELPRPPHINTNHRRQSTEQGPSSMPR